MKKIQINFVNIFHSLFKSKSYKPMTQIELFTELKISKSHQKEAVKALNTLIEKGEISVEKSRFVVFSKKQPRMTGILRMNPRGFGFVVPQEGKSSSEDAFIAKHNIGSAVDGDLVEVALLPETEKGPEGKIIAILERARSHLGGIVHFFNNDKAPVLYCPLLGQNKKVVALPPSFSLSVGDRVIVKILDWGDRDSGLLCEIVKVLGSLKDASIDVIAAAEEFQIASDFPLEVLKEAKSFGLSVRKKDCEGRVDFTGFECFTIDPTTAKDFDDALSLSVDEQGCYHLGVHIADVANYVKPSHPLDLEAKKRANSTYFPGSCFPMLPEELSNNLCSLKPNVIRLTVSVFMKFSPEGDLLSHDIARSFIKSAKRFTYEEAKQILDGKKKSKHKPALERMVQLCKLLKQKRSERGSIDFSLPEVVLSLDTKGEVESYHIVEYDITHQLVEEYMLKANEMVARTLLSRGIPLIFRTHEEPSEENKEEFYTLARSLGFFLPPKPTAPDLQALFDAARTTPFAQQLSVAFIRSMKLATYSPENVGHFGLALEEYCHFTSPIRRYPDLIIQRLLFGEHPAESPLEEIAKACSEKERVSFKAEQSVKTLKKLRLLQRWYKEEPDRVYTCQITRVRPFALSFELPLIGIEGSLHVSELGDDYFLYEPARSCFLGRESNVRLCVGDMIKVRITALDLILLEVRWTRIEAQRSSSSSKRKHKKKKRR